MKYISKARCEEKKKKEREAAASDNVCELIPHRDLLVRLDEPPRGRVALLLL
jgi:hypothetical protein